jgi:hypothetical protein
VELKEGFSSKHARNILWLLTPFADCLHQEPEPQLFLQSAISNQQQDACTRSGFTLERLDKSGV